MRRPESIEEAVSYLNKFRNYEIETVCRRVGTRIGGRRDLKIGRLVYVWQHGRREQVANAIAAVLNARRGGIGDGKGDNAKDINAERKIKELSDKLNEKIKTINELRKALKDNAGIRVKEPYACYVKPEGIVPKEYKRLIQLASQRVNILMVGPAGCGKSYLAAKIAKDLGLSFASVSCSAGMSESQLAGWLLPTGDGGRFEYHPSPFIQAYENGGVFLLDELDAADPNTLTFINSALANGGFHVPQRLGNPFVKRHPDFVCIAAANTYGNGADMVYCGRNQLDGATLDRFKAGTVTMNYDARVEEALVDSRVLAWGRRIRNNINRLGLRRIMSTRVMIELSKMAKAYDWGEAEWEQSYFADWSEDEKRQVLSNN